MLALQILNTVFDYFIKLFYSFENKFMFQCSTLKI